MRFASTSLSASSKSDRRPSEAVACLPCSHRAMLPPRLACHTARPADATRVLHVCRCPKALVRHKLCDLAFVSSIRQLNDKSEGSGDKEGSGEQPTRRKAPCKKKVPHFTPSAPDEFVYYYTRMENAPFVSQATGTRGSGAAGASTGVDVEESEYALARAGHAAVSAALADAPPECQMDVDRLAFFLSALRQAIEQVTCISFSHTSHLALSPRSLTTSHLALSPLFFSLSSSSRSSSGAGAAALRVGCAEDARDRRRLCATPRLAARDAPAARHTRHEAVSRLVPADMPRPDPPAAAASSVLRPAKGAVILLGSRAIRSACMTVAWTRGAPGRSTSSALETLVGRGSPRLRPAAAPPSSSDRCTVHMPRYACTGTSERAPRPSDPAKALGPARQAAARGPRVRRPPPR